VAAAVVAAAALVWSVGSGRALAQQPPASGPVTVSVAEVAETLWSEARAGRGRAAMIAQARKLGEGAGSDPAVEALRRLVGGVEAASGKLEATRVAETARVEKELADAMAGDGSPTSLSKALKAAVELHMIAVDKGAVLRRPEVAELIRKAEAAAKGAEAEGEWLMASQLFGRLNLLLEEEATYKQDVRRLGDRLTMVRLYVPERLHEMRDKARVAEGLKPLPPYNPFGEDFRAKVADVKPEMVYRALRQAAEQHVERKGMKPLIAGGLDRVRTMATTLDLRRAFPGLADDAARAKFTGWLDERNALLSAARAQPDGFELQDLIEELMAVNDRTVKIDTGALIHELGNGAFGRLDEFSSIIWPDELARFNRIMQSQFVGVGIQIQIDEETQMIKVVSPLDGTPAFKAGIMAGDLIKRIDGRLAVGMNLDQAIELITGKSGTRVTLTMEREGKDIDFTLQRDAIPVSTVKGWNRFGPGENDWDYFIDPESKIGYVRLTGFQNNTTSALHAAIDELKKGGAKGMILDLRYNPGGLLDQAVSVTNTFINSGVVVSTKDGAGPEARVTERKRAVASERRVVNMPLAVLINEGSASASEIVSGALKFYADNRQVDAVVVGVRSFGKGSVQTVGNLPGDAMMKLTQAYYFLPDNRLVHRRDQATSWGVDPHEVVEMLPKQISDALTLRNDADLPPAVRAARKGDKPPADPNRLLTEGLDLQLQVALGLVQARVAAKSL
jgi:carboxyl-terminal processing protease